MYTKQQQIGGGRT